VAAPDRLAVTSQRRCAVIRRCHRRAVRSGRRLDRHSIIEERRRGTLMRHVFLPGAPAAATHGMVHATAAARLVTSARSALGLMPGFLRAAAGAVDLAAITAAADEHLSVAANTQEQPCRPFHRISFVRAWTTSATGGILPRHACSAPCGARRRTRTWRFRSAPCLPIRQVAVAPLCPRGCAAALRSHLRRTAACGYVDNASALPTYPQSQQTAAIINMIA
jgi:hypothetical protein